MQLKSYVKNSPEMDEIEKLFDAIEHPDRFTQAEIEAMFQDRDKKQALETLDKMKSSLQSFSIPDIDAEWQIFNNKRINHETPKRNRFTRLLSRKAASIIAISIVSFAAVAVIMSIRVIHQDKRENAVADVRTLSVHVNASSQQDAVNRMEDSKATPEVQTFDNETLENIITRIAPYYDCDVIFSNDASRSIRLYFNWPQEQTIEEVIERLNNFDQINISLRDKTIIIN